jgi:hypothetical protein
MIAIETTHAPSLQLVAAWSAAIAAGVSGCFVFLNGILERRARHHEAQKERDARLVEGARERSANRKRLLVQEAAKLADWRVETAKRNSELSNRPVALTDPIVLMESYYKWLTHLWKHGCLPDDPRIER